MLTRIAYHALGMIAYLPPALEEDSNIQCHHKPQRLKLRESTLGLQAKKMRGKLAEFEKDLEHEEHDDDQDEHSDHSNKLDDQFNVNELLAHMEPLPQQMKDLFGQEDIDEYNAQLEAARIESITLGKEEKKRQKTGARTKYAHEGSSSATPTVSREPLPIPPFVEHKDTEILLNPASPPP